MSRGSRKPKQPDSLDCSIRSSLDGLSPLGAASHQPPNLEIEFVVTSTTEAAKEIHFVGNEIGVVHTSKVNPLGVESTFIFDIPQMRSPPENRDMDVWAQRPIFQKRVKEYQERTGKRRELVALDLGFALGTLRNYLYGSKTPGFPTLQRCAGVFGCSVFEFVDDPGAERQVSVDLSRQSAVDRYRIDQIATIMSDPGLSDDDRQTIYEEVKARAKWILSFKAKKD